MENIDPYFLMHAVMEADRCGLAFGGLQKLSTGHLVWESWVDPIYAYCGAGA